MKKLIAMFMVCSFAMTFIACGGGTSQSEAGNQETPAIEEPAAPAEEETPADSLQEEADTVTEQ